MNSHDKLNPIGAYLLADYYTTNVSRKDIAPKIQQPLYILNSPRDIPLIMHCAKASGIEQFGMIVVAGRRHRTPIVVNEDKCFILESLGSHSSFVGKNSIAQIAISVSKYSPDIEIHAAAAPRQVDGVSCGTDSFMAIKEALRNLRTRGDLFDYDSQQTSFSSQDIVDTEELQDEYFQDKSVQIKLHDDQPKCIAKYTQSDTLLHKSPYRFSQTDSSTLPSETLAEYSKRHQKIVSRESKETTDTEIMMLNRLEKIKLKKIKLSLSNDAVASRRKKHRSIFEQAQKTLTPETVEQIIQQYSGVNLVRSVAPNIPEEFVNHHDFSESDNLAGNFCAQEINRQRPDDKTALAPFQEISLGDIAHEIILEDKPEQTPSL